MNLDNAKQRIQDLTGQIRHHAASKRRKQNVFMGMGGVLAVVCCISLANLTSRGQELDADALTAIGRNEVQKNLPITRKKLQTHLQDEAPQLVGNGLQAMVDMLPNLRSYLTRNINDRFDALNGGFENNINALVGERIMKTKRSIDAAFPDLSDRQKLERLVAAVADDFNKVFVAAVDELYPRYADEMSGITRGISDLHTSPTATLTEEERIKKQIIATMVQIARRQKNGVN